jgi:hypothetical protein
MSPITPDEIAALAVALAACTPMERLSNMEVRAVLELLKQRGYLRKPPEDHVTATRRQHPAQPTSPKTEFILPLKLAAEIAAKAAAQ